MAERHSEEWRVVPSLPSYEASSLGRVRCSYPCRWDISTVIRRKPVYGSDYNNGMAVRHKSRKIFVHRLVCEAFNGPSPFAGAMVMHLDENYKNNRPENLQWGTGKENQNAPGRKKSRSWISYARR